VIADTLDIDYDMGLNLTDTTNVTSESSFLENLANNLTSDVTFDNFKNNSVMDLVTEDSVISTTVQFFGNLGNLTNNIVNNMSSSLDQPLFNLSQVCTNPLPVPLLHKKNFPDILN